MKEGLLKRKRERDRKKVTEKDTKRLQERLRNKWGGAYFVPNYYAGPSTLFASRIWDKLGLIAAKSIILRLWKNNTNCCIAEWMFSLTVASP